MAVLTASDIGDMVASTLHDLGRLKFQQVAQELVHYEVFSKWFKKNKVAFDGGIGIQRTLMARYDNSAAKHVGLMDTDTVNIIDVLEQLQVPWRHCQTNWGLIYQSDILMNTSGAKIVSTIKPRRASALMALVNELEMRAWASPAVSDKKNPWGLPYWVVKNATIGFNGGAPTGHTTVGGVSMTEVPGFKNYSGTYAVISKTDLIAKLRTMHRKIRFVSPVTIEDYRGSIGERYRNYVNEATISSIEMIGEAQNENLGRDIASMDGTMVFRKLPIVWVPKLDEDATNPWYMIDHSTFMPVALKGDYLRESRAERAPLQHNLYQVFIDLTYNFICFDRRRNGVLYV